MESTRIHVACPMMAHITPRKASVQTTRHGSRVIHLVQSRVIHRRQELISSVKAPPVASVGITLSLSVYVRFISFTKRNLLMKATIHHSVEELCEISKYDNIHDVFNTCVTMTCTVLGKPEGYRFYKFYTCILLY